MARVVGEWWKKVAREECFLSLADCGPGLLSRAFTWYYDIWPAPDSSDGKLDQRKTNASALQ